MNPLPARKYKLLYVDPPWAFRTYGNKKGQVPQRKAAQHYSVMSIDELKALPIDTVADKDCVLLMWIVDAHLKEALALAEAWGFTYKTLAFHWFKTRISLGHWTRKDSEFCYGFTRGDVDMETLTEESTAESCLLFSRGKPKRQSAAVRQTIVAPRREHSRKPDEAYALIEQLVPGPYLEIFARTDREGWDSWGNQTGKFNELSFADVI
jgi:N6-adenosine-specific RNA methylase IME4